VVLVDDLGTERLLTVFDGLKFSRTRVIANNGEDLLPEIKRSHIDFFKKNEEFLSPKKTSFIIVVNNQSLALEISRNEEKLPVEYLNVPCPALEGLKGINTPIKYILPEEILKKRRAVELKKTMTTMIVSFTLVAGGLSYWLFNRIELKLASDQYDLLHHFNEQLNEQLTLIDRATYREDLKRHKSLNFGVSYLAILDQVPSSYAVDSFKFTRSGRWNFEMSLLAEGEGPFDPIPRIKFLKNAAIKDIYVNDQPGKHLRMIL